ncbi:MAG: YfiR family protein [Nitrospinota bacterium]|nr:YfiR family protein [Nitrospinota bacterium]
MGRALHGYKVKALLATWLLLSLTNTHQALGQQASTGLADAANVKAAFLYQIANFIEWPPGVFIDKSSPLVIAVHENNPVMNALRTAAREATAAGRPIIVRGYIWPDDIDPSASIIYTGATTGKALHNILSLLSHRKQISFLVADGEEAAQEGAMMSFYLEDNRIRFIINVNAAGAAGIVISSKLLRLAKLAGEKTWEK